MCAVYCWLCHLLAFDYLILLSEKLISTDIAGIAIAFCESIKANYNQERQPIHSWIVRYVKRYYRCYTVLLPGTPVYCKASFVEMDIGTRHYLLFTVWRWFLFILGQQRKCYRLSFIEHGFEKMDDYYRSKLVEIPFHIRAIHSPAGIDAVLFFVI